MKKSLSVLAVGLCLMGLCSCGGNKESSVITEDQQSEIEKETVTESLNGVGMLSEAAPSSAKGLKAVRHYLASADKDSSESGSSAIKVPDTFKTSIAGTVKSYFGEFSYALDVNAKELKAEKSDKSEYDKMYKVSVGDDEKPIDFTLYYKSTKDEDKSDDKTHVYYTVSGLLTSTALDVNVPLSGSYEGKVTDKDVQIATDLKVAYNDNNYITYSKAYDEDEYAVDVTVLGKKVYSEKLAYNYTDAGNFSITIDKSSDSLFAYKATIVATGNNSISMEMTMDIPALGKTTFKASLVEKTAEDGTKSVEVTFDGDTKPIEVKEDK